MNQEDSSCASSPSGINATTTTTALSSSQNAVVVFEFLDTGGVPLSSKPNFQDVTEPNSKRMKLSINAKNASKNPPASSCTVVTEGSEPTQVTTQDQNQSSRVSKPDDPSQTDRRTLGRISKQLTNFYIEDAALRNKTAKNTMKTIMEDGERWMIRTGGKLYIHYEYEKARDKVSDVLGEEFIDANGRGTCNLKEMIEAAVTAGIKKALPINQEPQLATSSQATGGGSSSVMYSSPPPKAAAKRKPVSCQICRKELVKFPGVEAFQSPKLKCVAKNCSAYAHAHCLGLGNFDFEADIRNWHCPKHVAQLYKDALAQGEEES